MFDTLASHRRSDGSSRPTKTRKAGASSFSDAVWRNQLAADPHALGKTLRLNGLPYEVVGVMPPTFAFRGGASAAGFRCRSRSRIVVAVPFLLCCRPAARRCHVRSPRPVCGSATLAKQYSSNEDETSVVTRMSDLGITRLRSMLSTLLGAVALVLLIACVNVANLQLSQAVNRRREFVVRLALGAGIGRLSRQVLFEALTLALFGGAGGVGIAWLGTHSIGALLGPDFLDLPMRGPLQPAIDLAVLGFTLVVSLVCALLFGLAPLAGDFAAVVSRSCFTAAPAGRRGPPWARARARRRGSRAGARRPLRRRLVVEEPRGTVARRSGSRSARVLSMQVSLPQEDTTVRPSARPFVRISIAASMREASLSRTGRPAICRSPARTRAAP